MVATLAHELGHIHLLGHGRISDDVEDHEPLTDLLTVFFGMGIFTANAVMYEQYWENGVLSGWSMGRRGYLGMPVYGYALARFARLRRGRQGVVVGAAARRAVGVQGRDAFSIAGAMTAVRCLGASDPKYAAGVFRHDRVRFL